MNDQLKHLLDSPEHFTALDRHFADLMSRLAGSTSLEFRLLVQFLCRTIDQGGVCIDLATVSLKDIVNSFEGYDDFDIDFDWKSLSQYSVVGSPGEVTPLILDSGGLFYLYRYWRYEDDVANWLRTRANRNHRTPQKDQPIDLQSVRKSVSVLFSGENSEDVDWQLIATLVSLEAGVSVVSGGPGTGKTTTVVKLLALQRLLREPSERVALAAPTGKAAGRLSEAIRSGEAELPTEIQAGYDVEVVTLHRLLGARRDGSFRHHSKNTLPFDLIVVDEASMVDLRMMASLVAALSDNTRLILVGDHNQLASVEAGSVFADIATVFQRSGYSDDFRGFVRGVSDITLPETMVPEIMATTIYADHSVVLEKNYRFLDGGGIAGLASKICDGDVTAVKQWFGQDETCIHIPVDTEDGLNPLVEQLIAQWQRIIASGDPESAFSILAELMVLSPHRKGSRGVEAVNRMVENGIRRKSEYFRNVSGNTGDFVGDEWYSGRPIIVLRNDYRLGLFNGDVGICLPDPEQSQKLMVWFPRQDGYVRVAPSLLAFVDSVWALTVHKSQGSEAKRVVLLLPEKETQNLTRELLYTAVTRARESVEVWGDLNLFATGAATKTDRASGLVGNLVRTV